MLSVFAITANRLPPHLRFAGSVLEHYRLGVRRPFLCHGLLRGEDIERSRGFCGYELRNIRLDDFCSQSLNNMSSEAVTRVADHGPAVEMIRYAVTATVSRAGIYLHVPLKSHDSNAHCPPHPLKILDIVV